MSWGMTGVVVRYGEHVALDGVDLHVEPGEVVMVVGGDGAGKTTLLRTLAGAIRPNSGEVHAPDLSGLGFLPTRAGSWAELTVDENIQFVAAAHGLTGAALAARRTELLAATGLAAAHGRLSAQLSGGMRQKLAFVLATLHRPPLLVLDEPTTGVDPASRTDLWSLISGAAATGTAVVMATTYLDEAERGTRVLVLDCGRVLLAGAPDDVVGAVPGSVVHASARGPRTWRRGHEVHAWVPPGAAAPGGAPRLVPDLEDAVIATSLHREAARG